jgi:cytochrome c
MALTIGAGEIGVNACLREIKMRLMLMAAASVLLVGMSHAADVDKGKSQFAKCGMCHAVGPDAKNKIGPQLNGVVGRTIAAVPEFSYSQSMKDLAAANPVWTEDLLDQYLENPKALVPGGKMAFAGLKKPEDRQNVIAYLKTNP